MTQYFQINHALETHNLIIKKSGGMQGIKDNRPLGVCFILYTK